MFRSTKLKYLYLLISLLFVLAALAGCGETQTTSAPAQEEAQVKEPAAEAEEPAAEAEEPAAEAEEPAAEAEEPAAEAEEPAAEAMAEGGLPEVDPLSVTGDIITAGSSTVFPLTERMADRFTDEGYAGTISIDSIGTGGGFERFCVAAETDIANASRPINEEESAACRENGRDPIEFRVGTDALAVVVSSENDFVEDVTLEELALIYSTAETWADVRPEWPAEPIQRFSPGTDSGTFDYFVEAVLDEDEAPLLNAANLQLSEDDNVLVQGVEGSPYGIGYFGYAYFQENEGRLKALSINGIAPTAETAENGEYPLARPLFIYSDATVMQEKPQVAAFINYYLTHVNEEVIDVGYFPASESALEEARDNWLVGVGMKEGS